MVKRFRSVSPQLQDSECGRLKEGMVVCVGCNAFGGDDMLFYDAVIEAHTQCVAEVGPKIAPFLKLVNRNFGKSSCMLTSASKYEKTASEGSSCENGGSNLSIISSFEGMNSSKSIVDVTTGAKIRKYSRLWEDDKDLGWQCPSYHLLLIENLERNLLPSSFRNFIHEHTSVSVQAYIFPSPSMQYASGIIVVDAKRSVRRYSSFWIIPPTLLCPQLEVEDLVILDTAISTSEMKYINEEAEPLVVTERNLRHDMINMWSGSYEPQDMHLVTSLDKDLMVVHSGTEAYERAKQLKDLFQEFTSHQQVLYKRFAVEEMMILQKQQQQFNQIIDV
ncbi:hypothetical protein P3S68_004140 [Capsicum galapagoense]